jgi:FtsP/CotA-like multicopper oxidase with cupredoxin domain
MRYGEDSEVNDTDIDHPMHLHGHFFYVVSRNGEKGDGFPD